MEGYGERAKETANANAPSSWCSVKRNAVQKPMLIFDELRASGLNKENAGDKAQTKLFKSKAKKAEVSNAKSQAVRHLFPNLSFNQPAEIQKESSESQDDSLLLNSPKSEVSVVLDKSPRPIIDSVQKEFKRKLLAEPDTADQQSSFEFKQIMKPQQEESQDMLSRLLNTGKNKAQGRERTVKNPFNTSLLMSDSKDTFPYFK